MTSPFKKMKLVPIDANKVEADIIKTEEANTTEQLSLDQRISNIIESNLDNTIKYEILKNLLGDNQQKEKIEKKVIRKEPIVISAKDLSKPPEKKKRKVPKLKEIENVEDYIKNIEWKQY